MGIVDLNNALHVVDGDSAAASLRCAFKLSRHQILVNEDAFGCGPAPATDDLDLWRSTRERYLKDMYVEWPDFSFDEYANNGLLSNVRRLAGEGPVVVWLGLGVPDQLLLAWMVFLFDRLGLGASNVSVVEFARFRSRETVRTIYDLILGVGELSPEDIRAHCPKPRHLNSDELEELRRAWRVYTSSDPADLSRFSAEARQTLPVHQAVGQLVYRYPDKRTGMSIWDQRLLNHTTEQGQAAIRVIGNTFGLADTLDVVGDSYLFRRLINLGSSDLRSPLVTITGNTRAMRECNVKLTSFGQKVLAGEANHVHENGIDDWIGGVHLTSERPVTFRDGDTLVVPD